MSSKRKEPEPSDDAPPAKRVHIKRIKPNSHNDKIAKKTPQKHRPVGPTVPVSVNELKRRIRDVKRLLDRVDLPADARIVQERALAGYQKDLEEEMARRKRSEMIKKYHFVRFLERKAATKELKRLLRKESEISQSSSPTKDEDLQRLAPLIHTARVNLNYTIYHPLNEKYISLYPTEKKKEKKERKQRSPQTDDNDNDDHRGEDSASDSESHRSRSRSESQQPRDGGDDISDLLICDDSPEKPPMWYVVEKCMADDTLDLLRQGKLDTGLGGGRGEKTDSSSASSANGKETAAAKSKSAKDKPSGREKEKEKQKQKQNYSSSSSSKPAKNKKGGRKGKEEDVEMRDAEGDDDESDGGFFE
ncbi:hypothetical protein VTN02DRAFT_5575 [Thermoascus thermophilus]